MTYKQPKLNENSFTCPYCKIETGHQFVSDKLVRHYQNAYYEFYAVTHISRAEIKKELKLSISTCAKCKQIEIWINDDMVYPKIEEFGPEATEDMPELVKGTFNEARKVFGVSVRAAAALLRLAIEQYCEEMGYRSKRNLSENLKDMINEENLSNEFEESCKYIRLIGNDAVHPRELSISEDEEAVLFMFELLNQLVEEMITNKNKRERLFNKVLNKNPV